MIITGIEKDREMLLLKAKLLGSFLFFLQTFFKLRTGRDFELSHPIGRESHQITICRELTKVFNLETNRLIINIPPGHGKSTLLSYFIAWCFAHYPDCQFLYISYSHELAAKHTANIKAIMQIPEYGKLFGTKISRDSSAKDDFKTNAGGSVKAFGSSGGITGQDAGLPNLDRYSGGVIMDDMHKPDEVHSDTIRDGVIQNYNETIKPRPRAPNVPIVGIGQRLHELDIFGFLAEEDSEGRGGDGNIWKKVILKALDDVGNILCPSLTPMDMLKREEEFNEYVFSAQYQQNPQPAGGGIFKPDRFVRLEHEPKILATFLTVDTAETNKTYNDASVFSFWGIYEMTNFEVGTGEFGLHWIDCTMLHVEPSDLQAEFMSFYGRCMQHPVKPMFAAIEKKSTGTTLISILNKLRGLDIRDIERTRASGNKTTRYYEIQPYISKRLISLPVNGSHTDMCIEHMRKITANNTHRFDDIADTLYDAVKIGLMSPTMAMQLRRPKEDKVLHQLVSKMRRVDQLRNRAWRR